LILSRIGDNPKAFWHILGENNKPICNHQNTHPSYNRIIHVGTQPPDGGEICGACLNVKH
jgi:hypothetical protein